MSKLLVLVVSHGPKASTLMLGEWVWLGTLLSYSFPFILLCPHLPTHTQRLGESEVLDSPACFPFPQALLIYSLFLLVYVLFVFFYCDFIGI